MGGLRLRASVDRDVIDELDVDGELNLVMTSGIGGGLLIG